jgi:hypothetical protein
LRYIRKRVVHGTIWRLLDMGREWARERAIGLPQSLLNFRSSETLRFEKLDTLCQRGGLSLEKRLRLFCEEEMEGQKTLGSARNETALRMYSCLSAMSAVKEEKP